MSCRVPRKSLMHFCTETSLETNFSKSPKTFPLTNPIGLSQVFNPLDLYASVSTAEILSSHGFPGCSLCSSTTSSSHLLTVLFCLPPPPWLTTAPEVQNLAFCISPSVFTTRIHTPHALLSYHLAQMPPKSTIKAWSLKLWS